MKLKKIALFDIDNTIYDGYIFFPLAEFQLRERIINQNCLGELYKDFKLYKAGKIDYETTIVNLLIHWAEGLKGISCSTILKKTERFFRYAENKFFPYFKPTVVLLRKTYDIYFVTGEPHFVGQILSEIFGITGFISSEFEVRNGVFTGEVKISLARREEKLIAIRRLLEEYNPKDSFAFGDSEGDIEMLNSVEHPVCINPTKGLRKIAQKRSWDIIKPNEVEKKIVKVFSKNSPNRF